MIKLFNTKKETKITNMCGRQLICQGDGLALTGLNNVRDGRNCKFWWSLATTYFI